MKHYLSCIATFLIGILPDGLCYSGPDSSTPLAPMQCFTGNCTTFQECRRLEMIADCPSDQVYDACLTMIDQKAHGKLTIVKKCGQSPCTQSEMDWWGDECDRKSDEDSYTCTSCCTETLCNSSFTLSSSPWILAVISLTSSPWFLGVLFLSLTHIEFAAHAVLDLVYSTSALDLINKV